MAKRPDITTIASGYYSRQALNNNFESLRDKFDNTLSLDGSTPNAMNADLDLNGNNIIGATGLFINGTDYLAEVESAKAAALVAQAAAELAETNAETAEVNAETSETNAAASAAAALVSQNAAFDSETVSAVYRSDAQTSAVAAQTAETGAETAETNAAASEANAATSETNAATSATNAATSESNAASSASSAQASKDAALAALDSFDDRYLGQKASDPTVDNDGDPLVAGALYFNTTDDAMKVYEGSVWVAAYASLSGALLQANNLSDLASATSARTNLGLGTAATTDSTDYATAAQGSLADSAVQSGDLSTVATTGVYSDLTGKPTLGTAAATASTDYATAAQGSTADSAVQPNDSPTFGTVTATSFEGDGSALTGVAGTPAGAVIYHAVNTPPTGFIKANGASLSTTTYADLFAVIGYTFGGSGASFKVPDLRGEFIRAWDDARGVDSGRSFGSAQADEFKSHNHSLTGRSNAGSSGTLNEFGSDSDTESYSNTTSIGFSGGSETRPRNIALLACIKY
eukprot:GHVL01025229.1.p1 GENE.GHVL01025229.1~~GHVL01025229.1.p1  ORF type:complete len:521 (+),score=79.37 GHVL01025229.1:1483-3045(+)